MEPHSAHHVNCEVLSLLTDGHHSQHNVMIGVTHSTWKFHRQEFHQNEWACPCVRARAIWLAHIFRNYRRSITNCISKLFLFSFLFLYFLIHRLDRTRTIRCAIRLCVWRTQLICVCVCVSASARAQWNIKLLRRRTHFRLHHEIGNDRKKSAHRTHIRFHQTIKLSAPWFATVTAVVTMNRKEYTNKNAANSHTRFVRRHMSKKRSPDASHNNIVIIYGKK